METTTAILSLIGSLSGAWLAVWWAVSECREYRDMLDGESDDE